MIIFPNVHEKIHSDFLLLYSYYLRVMVIEWQIFCIFLQNLYDLKLFSYCKNRKNRTVANFTLQFFANSSSYGTVFSKLHSSRFKGFYLPLPVLRLSRSGFWLFLPPKSESLPVNLQHSYVFFRYTVQTPWTASMLSPALRLQD